MPVPGPRTQFRPVPGYTNPDRRLPDRINLWFRPGPVASTGRSPGTMIVSVRGSILAPGTIRRLWRQTVNQINAQAPYSWTASSPSPGNPRTNPGAYMITRALRYMTQSVYIGAGEDNTRYSALHTKIEQRVNSKPVSLNAGQNRNRPTVRNRLTSFGSRVPPLNPRVSAAEKDDHPS
jgi:hypothetical protein